MLCDTDFNAGVKAAGSNQRRDEATDQSTDPAAILAVIRAVAAKVTRQIKAGPAQPVVAGRGRDMHGDCGSGFTGRPVGFRQDCGPVRVV
jgi:hypothetical protein